MDKLCSKNKIRAAKVVRATMEEIGHFLHKNKECTNQIKVIYLLRDPRGRLNSLNSLHKFNYSNHKAVAKMCDREMKDVQTAKCLEDFFPGTFLQVKYEDLAADTIGVSERIYNFLFDSYLAPEVEKFMKANTSKTTENAWNTKREDPKATSLAWMMEMSPKANKIVQENCKELIDHLSY